jgi:hypothetical protein
MMHGQTGRHGVRFWVRGTAVSRAARVSLAACLLPLPVVSVFANQLDLAPFRAASCAELQGEYKATLEVNRKVLEEMRSTEGEPTYANLGLGLYTAISEPLPQSPQEALKAYQKALRTVAGEKKCVLPAAASGLEAKAP